MAKQKFLQATFTGSLGGITAAQAKGKNVIKQKKWAKCHNGELSNNCCRAFQALHRICTRVAPLLANSILERVPTIDRIPKLEKLWKEWISPHNFTPSNIALINHLQLPFTLQNISYNEFTTTLTFDIQGSVVLPTNQTCIMLFFVHNEVGQVFAIHFYPYRDTQITIQLAGIVEHQLFLSGMGLIQTQNKWLFGSPFSTPIYLYQP